LILTLVPFAEVPLLGECPVKVFADISTILALFLLDYLLVEVLVLLPVVDEPGPEVPVLDSLKC